MFEGMQLRQTSGCACVRIGLATVALALAASPAAFAASEKPKPDALWQAFPLEPAPERAAPTLAPPATESPSSPLLPPAQGRSEATTVTDAPSEGSGPSVFVPLFAALLVLLATVVVLSGRRLYARRHQRGASMPLWQGVTWPPAADNVRQLQQPQARASSALVGTERRAEEPHPDVSAPRYRWADQARGRARPSVDISTMIHRLRRAVWTEDSAPAIVGGAAAAILGVLLVYLIG